MTAQALRKELLALGLDDEIQLFEIIHVVGEYFDIDHLDESAVMGPTLDAIRDLLETKYMIAGDAVKDGKGSYVIRPWGLGASDAIARIEKEWRELEEPPNLGDVVWLDLTDAGQTEARKPED